MNKDLLYKHLFDDLKNHLDIQIIKTNIESHHPDSLFIFNNIHYIIEHSSTGDRKSHLGELLQVYIYTKLNKSKSTFILILDNQTPGGPKKESEQKYLEYYLNQLNSDNLNLKILVLNFNEINTIELLKSIISNIKI